MFSGLVYCADCGEKLYYSSTGNYKREQANFFCSTYRKDSDKCSVHFIREKVIYDLVLEDMRWVFDFVTNYEEYFARMQMYSFGEERQKELKSKRTELKKAQKRVDEIDGLIQKLFENNASGKLSDERFETLTSTYEKEQSELKSKIPELENEIDNSVQLATDKNFEKNVVKKTVSDNKATNKKISSLNAGTKYFVRIRTYKTVDGKKYYSAWSDASGVKSKK